MTDTRVDQQATETITRPVPLHTLTQQATEVLARERLLRLNAQALEALTVPVPDLRLTHGAVEVLSLPNPPAQFLHQSIEVIWREPATPDILVWGHNWVAEVRERLEWKTDVLTARAGG